MRLAEKGKPKDFIYLICNLLLSLKLRISEVCCFSTGDTFESSLLLHWASIGVKKYNSSELEEKREKEKLKQLLI